MVTTKQRNVPVGGKHEVDESGFHGTHTRNRYQQVVSDVEYIQPQAEEVRTVNDPTTGAGVQVNVSRYDPANYTISLGAAFGVEKKPLTDAVGAIIRIPGKGFFQVAADNRRPSEVNPDHPSTQSGFYFKQVTPVEWMRDGDGTGTSGEFNDPVLDSFGAPIIITGRMKTPTIVDVLDSSGNPVRDKHTGEIVKNFQEVNVNIQRFRNSTTGYTEYKDAEGFVYRPYYTWTDINDLDSSHPIAVYWSGSTPVAPLNPDENHDWQQYLDFSSRYRRSTRGANPPNGDADIVESFRENYKVPIMTYKREILGDPITNGQYYLGNRKGVKATFGRPDPAGRIRDRSHREYTSPEVEMMFKDLHERGALGFGHGVLSHVGRKVDDNGKILEPGVQTWLISSRTTAGEYKPGTFGDQIRAHLSYRTIDEVTGEELIIPGNAHRQKICAKKGNNAGVDTPAPNRWSYDTYQIFDTEINQFRKAKRGDIIQLYLPNNRELYLTALHDPAFATDTALFDGTGGENDGIQRRKVEVMIWDHDLLVDKHTGQMLLENLGEHDNTDEMGWASRVFRGIADMFVGSVRGRGADRRIGGLGGYGSKILGTEYTTGEMLDPATERRTSKGTDTPIPDNPNSYYLLARYIANQWYTQDRAEGEHRFRGKHIRTAEYALARAINDMTSGTRGLVKDAAHAAGYGAVGASIGAIGGAIAIGATLTGVLPLAIGLGVIGAAIGKTRMQEKVLQPGQNIFSRDEMEVGKHNEEAGVEGSYNVMASRLTQKQGLGHNLKTLGFGFTTQQASRALSGLATYLYFILGGKQESMKWGGLSFGAASASIMVGAVVAGPVGWALAGVGGALSLCAMGTVLLANTVGRRNAEYIRDEWVHGKERNRDLRVFEKLYYGGREGEYAGGFIKTSAFDETTPQSLAAKWKYKVGANAGAKGGRAEPSLSA